MTPLDILKKYWGYHKFYPLQEKIINNVLEKKDLLVLFPTGGGKSICWQIPALMETGICLIISPLISLMRDQVIDLKNKKIPSNYISSEKSEKEIDIILDDARYGKIQIIYISPERLKNKKFIERIKYLKISFITIDEAHCISQWGYNFRPSYLQIACLRKIFPRISFVALTGSATLDTTYDIMEKLEFKNKLIIRKSFFRSNLSYQIIYTNNKLNSLNFYLLKYKGSSIIFVRSREKTKEISDYLNMNGFKSDYYHSKLHIEDKKFKEKNWKKEYTPIIVTTNAFGLGINKINVRLIFHWDFPDSIESYFQEVGRAGRDGENSYCVLFYNKIEIENKKYELLKFFLSKKKFQNICQKLFDYYQVSPGECPKKIFTFDLFFFSKHYKQSKTDINQVIKHLECSGLLKTFKENQISIQFKFSLEQINTLYINKILNKYFFNQFIRKHPKVLKIPLETSLYEISKLFNIHFDKLEIFLEKLHKNKLIIYNKSIQRLRFILHRDDNYIKNFIWNSLEKIQLRQYNNFKELIFYITKKTICRSQLLLIYFGEKDSIPCKQCDVCLKYK